MNIPTLRKLLAVLSTALTMVGLPAFAQQPPVSAPTNAPATADQAAAVADFTTRHAGLVNAVTAARSALVEASFSSPARPAEIRSRAESLAAAELELALARADWLAALQAGSDRLNAAQLIALRNQAAADGGGRGGFSASEPLNFEDHTGFVPLFDGRTLDGWSGVSNWKVVDGAITVNGGFGTTYLIYNRKKFRNFELKLEFRIVNGSNSGVQYRARLSGGARGGRGGNVPDNPAALAALTASPHDTDPAFLDTAGTIPGAVAGGPAAESRGGLSWQWDVGGYQYDLGGRGTGNLYEQDGRGTVVSVGNVSILDAGLTGPRATVVGRIGGNAEGDIPGEWNRLHLIAEGPMLVHITNDQLSSVTFDNDPNYAATEGWLALQIEGGGQLSFRNIYLKELP